MILIVDDQAAFREPVAAALRREGFKVLCAANGREALGLARQRHPDLILLDLAMPVMDGLVALKQLRADPETGHLPVIVLTAMAEREAVIEVARLGVKAYLLKSRFSLDKLLETVRQHLGEASAARDEAGLRAHARRRADAASAAGPSGPGEPPSGRDKAHVLKEVHGALGLRAVPPVLGYVVALTHSDTSSIEEIAGAIRHDQALALKVMKLANSTFYGRGKPILSLSEAAQRIGVSGIRNSIAAILAIEHFAGFSATGLIPQRFWEHSLATGVLAERLGQAVGARDAQQLFLAGLLHDVGRVVLSTVFPRDYGTVLAAGARQGVDLVVPEREQFGLSHAEVTKEVLVRWNVPHAVLDAASAHELEIEQIERTADNPQAALVVALANRLAHALALGDSGNSLLLPMAGYAKALGLSGEAIRSIARGAVEKMQDSTLFYASQSDQTFRQPLIRELAAKARGPIRLALLAGHAADPLALFCEQLGWSDSAEPRVAVLHAAGERELAHRFRDLEGLEQPAGAKLPVLVASPGASLALPAETVRDRRWATLAVPGRYADLVQAIVTFCNSVREAATAMSGGVKGLQL